MGLCGVLMMIPLVLLLKRFSISFLSNIQSLELTVPDVDVYGKKCSKDHNFDIILAFIISKFTGFSAMNLGIPPAL